MQNPSVYISGRLASYVRTISKSISATVVTRAGLGYLQQSAAASMPVNLDVELLQDPRETLIVARNQLLIVFPDKYPVMSKV